VTLSLKEQKNILARKRRKLKIYLEKFVVVVYVVMIMKNSSIVLVMKLNQELKWSNARIINTCNSDIDETGNINNTNNYN
jgi:hypothetical protein